MQREEAIAIVKKADRTTKLLDEYLVDALVALGMLKLDEPKSAEDRAIDVLAGNHSGVALSRFGAASIVDVLTEAGLKIVEK